jgi:hypothetical protein
MHDTTALHAAVAQRLFGWTYTPHHTLPVSVWRDPAGGGQAALPAYTTDPAATAQVWQWVETLSMGVDYLKFDYYPTIPKVRCWVELYHHDDFLSGEGGGATWPEALCRAALALAQALEREETR